MNLESARRRTALIDARKIGMQWFGFNFSIAIMRIFVCLSVSLSVCLSVCLFVSVCVCCCFLNDSLFHFFVPKKK